MKPTDPIEGVLISQLVTASQASLSMYRRAWALPPEHFEARMARTAGAERTMLRTMDNSSTTHGKRETA